MTPQTMSQSSLQSAATAILTAAREACDTPASGCYALAIALYTLWVFHHDTAPFEDFLADFTASVKDLHAINTCQGGMQ